MTPNVDHVYFIFIEDSSGKRFYKIGKSVNVEQRIKSIEGGCPFPIQYEFYLRMEFKSFDESALKVENLLHRELREVRFRGEWFEDCEKLQSLLMSIKESYPDNIVYKKKKNFTEKLKALMP